MTETLDQVPSSDKKTERQDRAAFHFLSSLLGGEETRSIRRGRGDILISEREKGRSVEVRFELQDRTPINTETYLISENGVDSIHLQGGLVLAGSDLLLDIDELFEDKSKFKPNVDGNVEITLSEHIASTVRMAVERGE